MATYQKPVVVIYPPTTKSGGTTTNPSNPVGNPVQLTTSGGLSGSKQVFGFPYKDFSTGKTYFCTFDPYNLNDTQDSSIYKTKQEDVSIYRKPTIRNVILVYRNRGLCVVTVTLSVMTLSMFNSFSCRKTIGTVAADNTLMSAQFDFNNISGERPQITVQREANAGMLDIISLTMAGAIEDTTIG